MKFKKFRNVSLIGFLAAALMLFGAGFSPVYAQSDNKACEQPYVVQPGDILSRIAQQCGVSYHDLVDANPQIDNPNRIYPGQEINLPGYTGPGVGIPVTGGSVYLVQPGDTLSTIADHFQITIADLYRANPGLSQVEPVRAGQQIRLPQGAERVPVVSVSPTATAPGALVTVAATGFEANREVLLGFGLESSDVDSTTPLTTDANGAVYRTVQFPEWASLGERYVFVVERADNEDVRAVSNPIWAVADTGTGIPVTGPNTYLVQRGDTLSEIAVRFGVSMEELLQHNPDIENPAVIISGQRISLPEDARPVVPWVDVSHSSAAPGQQIRVRAINFPAGARVDVRLAPLGEQWVSVVDARANSKGEVSAAITVPHGAPAGAQWQAIVTTTERAEITRAVSQAFVIR